MQARSQETPLQLSALYPATLIPMVMAAYGYVKDIITVIHPSDFLKKHLTTLPLALNILLLVSACLKFALDAFASRVVELLLCVVAVAKAFGIPVSHVAVESERTVAVKRLLLHPPPSQIGAKGLQSAEHEVCNTFIKLLMSIFFWIFLSH